jgi:hypothetical protein
MFNSHPTIHNSANKGYKWFCLMWRSIIMTPPPKLFMEFDIYVTLSIAMQPLSLTSDHANMMLCMMHVVILVINMHDKTNI